MDKRSEFTSLLADAASAELAIPLACPMEIANGRYVLEEVIDAGRRAWVYRATDRRLSSQNFDASVIIKVFKTTSGEESESLLARRVEHPNIIGVIDRGSTTEGHPYVVMAHAKGGDLGRMNAPIEPRLAAELVAKVADAVQCLHNSGIVHCDIKPANILLSEAGEPMLADFELAASPITDSVAFRGTLAFMSPEQKAGGAGALGPLTDVYGLGAVLFYLLMGHETDSIKQPSVRGRRGGVPSSLLDVCNRAMAFDRNDRQVSAAELALDLRRWLKHLPIEWQNPPPSRRLLLACRRRPALAIAIIVAMLAVIGFGIPTFLLYERYRQRELANAATALAIAETRVRELKLQVRNNVKLLVQMLGVAQGNASDETLLVLVWLDWLGSSSLVSEDGRIVAGAERLQLLKSRLDLLERERPQIIESLVVRMAIAELELRAGNSQAALSIASETQALWSSRVSAEDPIMATLSAIVACSRFDQGSPDKEVRDALTAASTNNLLGLRIRNEAKRRLAIGQTAP